MAGKGLKGWQDAKTQAQKVLGKEGRLPKPRVEIEGVMQEANKVAGEINKVRDTMESKILDAQNAFSKVKNAASQYDDMVQGSDFGLDPKNADAKKQIADAQKILSAQLAEIEGLSDQATKIFSDVDKTLTGIQKQIDLMT